MTNPLYFRPYAPSDKEDCIRIFKSNQPKFFTEKELEDFKTFLDKESSGYYVAILDGKIIGSGGIFMDEDKNAGLSWGMIDSSLHQHGYGRQLTQFRLAEIERNYRPRCIRMDTIQPTYAFYEKFGFKITKIHKDGIAPGIDKYDMEKKTGK